MCILASLLVQFGDHLRRAAVRRYPPQTTVVGRREDDVVVLAPASSALAGSIAQCDGCAPTGIDLLKLFIGEEGDGLPIRGKERSLRSLRSGERHRLRLVQPAHRAPRVCN